MSEINYIQSEYRQKQKIVGIELQNTERIRTIGKKETFKYLEIFEADTIELVEIKGKKRKKRKQMYIWQTRKLLEIYPAAGN